MPQWKSCSALLLFHILKDPDTGDFLKQLVLQLTFGGISGQEQRSPCLIHRCFSCSVGDLMLRVVAACWSCDLWLWLLTFGRADGFSRVPLALPAAPITFHCHRRDRPSFIPSLLGTSCSDSVQLCCCEHGQSPDFACLSLSGSPWPACHRSAALWSCSHEPCRLQVSRSEWWELLEGHVIFTVPYGCLRGSWLSFSCQGSWQWRAS